MDQKLCCTELNIHKLEQNQLIISKQHQSNAIRITTKNDIIIHKNVYHFEN